MSFDPELFGQAMGDAIIKAVQPLKDEIARLKAQLAELPRPLAGKDGTDGRDGKDCDMEAVKKMIDEAVKSIPVVHGKDGADGKDGEPGAKGEDGQKGADGLGMAGAMIDREGALLVTMSNGEVKNLGPVVGSNGRDGSDGKDGVDGLGLEAFELEYLDETHEVRIKASCAGRVKEIRYPAGGIRPGGYWREGHKLAHIELASVIDLVGGRQLPYRPLLTRLQIRHRDHPVACRSRSLGSFSDVHGQRVARFRNPLCPHRCRPDDDVPPRYRRRPKIRQVERPRRHAEASAHPGHNPSRAVLNRHHRPPRRIFPARILLQRHILGLRP